MTLKPPTNIRPALSVDHINRLETPDLDALVAATQATIEEGSQNSWRGNPSTQRLTAFWNGVLLSPHRHLILGRIAGEIVGGLQIVQAGPLSDIGPEVASIDNFFLAPCARGKGLAAQMLRHAEDVALAQGITSLDVVVRDDRREVARTIEALGYKLWARKDTFRWADNQFHAGLYYTKVIDDAALSALERTSAA